MDDEAARIRRYAAQVARENLLSYVLACDPKFTPDPFHRYLCAELEKVALGETKRLVISVHPRAGKSRLTAVEFLAWMLGKVPDTQIICASHSGAMAADNSILCRNRLFNPVHRLVFPKSEPGLKQQRFWGVRGGGRYLAIGIGGKISGRGADILLIDDAFGSFEEAHSESQRDKVWHWWMSDAYARLSPNGAVIVISTRFHPDDLVGRLTSPERKAQMKEEGVGESEDWKVINLPALALKDDQFGRAEGEALVPSRWPVQRLLQVRAVTAGYIWEATWQQRPKKMGAGIIKTDRMLIIQPSDCPTGLRWVRFWDLATTAKKKADHTAGARVALKDDVFYISAIKRGQWEWPTARNKIQQQTALEPIEIGVEEVGLGAGLVQNLREVLPPTVRLRGVTPDKDKLSRANPWIGLAENHKVRLVNDGNWIPDFVSECEAFTGDDDDTDDQIDAVSGGYAMVKSSKGPMF